MNEAHAMWGLAERVTYSLDKVVKLKTGGAGVHGKCLEGMEGVNKVARMLGRKELISAGYV